MKYSYVPHGVCSQLYNIEIEDNQIKEIEIVGGCPGNTFGLSVLLKGMNVDDAISRLQGINCRGRGTSCPDQISLALDHYKEIKETN